MLTTFDKRISIKVLNSVALECEILEMDKTDVIPRITDSEKQKTSERSMKNLQYLSYDIQRSLFRFDVYASQIFSDNSHKHKNQTGKKIYRKIKKITRK